MHSSAAQFVFMSCRPGAEAALKQEVARIEPGWRLAFSRPGFLTYKQVGAEPLDEKQLAQRHLVFAHRLGVSISRFQSAEVGQLAEQVWSHPDVAASAGTSDGFADVHVWQRDPKVSGDEATRIVIASVEAEIESAVRAAAPDTCSKLRKHAGVTTQHDEGSICRKQVSGSGRRRPSERGGRVLDIVVVEPGQWWVGYHRASGVADRWPGGAIPVVVPEHAVSRAYAKMEEALAWSGLPLAAGDECVEIGCAPGGASQALLDRGMFVTGIDPAEVDPAVVAHPRFRHLKKRGKEVRRNEFFGVRWLAADINIAPTYTLDTVEAIVAHPEVTIRGLVLTLKLAEWSDAARIPGFIERVRGWGFRDVRVRQLASGGQEVCLVALRRRALRRLSGKSTQKRVRRPRGGTGSDAQQHDAPPPPPREPTI